MWVKGLGSTSHLPGTAGRGKTTNYFFHFAHFRSYIFSGFLIFLSPKKKKKKIRCLIFFYCKKALKMSHGVFYQSLTRTTCFSPREKPCRVLKVVAKREFWLLSPSLPLPTGLSSFPSRRTKKKKKKNSKTV